MDINVIIASTVGLFVITLLLVTMLLFAKAKLLPSGPVKLIINGEKNVEVNSGDTLLTTLGNNKIFLPSACGGGGTCVQCKCQVVEGGGEILPTEEPHFTRKEISEGWRLGCQVKVKQDMKIEVPEEVFGIKKWEAKVKSNYNVASFIKEFVIEIPEEMDYKAGGYIQIEIPECDINYNEMDITSHPDEHPDNPQKFKLEWDKFNLWPLNMKNNETVERAYSMASYPAEGKQIMLNVRIATPPWDGKKNNWMTVNPGIASSYIFSKKPGDTVTISGPYGEFFINDSDAEMLYVGGGAGMAPMRSHLYELFRTIETGRKVTFWYGGRSKRELFYVDHFRALEKDYPNFKFYIALSEPLEEDNWKVKDSLDSEGDGFTGFIHQVVIDNYLSKHESPEDIEVYFCGPPLMNVAVAKMAEDFGVPPENVRFDDFGG
ncbi:MAG: NADH:ubiquinone reductase (Na(+)-transporting) subunit F [Candidatus Marisimplicoccus sp.]|jgi:Na+-transporting NADH:ubiquinone oxidoreductase subunit F|nr:NADH:ubiquinone reductase (Na(+)-transporting) subunit F [Cryomorphaceae bacterium]MCH1443906.1 NADH:ubiquinone reductase (Na(+)-transporting) subunit F [Flavobacteriaceae bacterium]RZP00034.1 MAG: NADH:ubiquinone reductase (Na(+)-transporting) subunit F [Flavobacteriales bacterium]MBT7739493.1 NADH:ubiquinone reductase (Na(+)-transporting) subunit F [Cryomorphaceae bacterium]MDA9160479.1 NADH:ubiquinone reductase (Na(+)-transporting) subunit F [Flavobacteriaceae bacterium]|tara:strand:- start:61 stop:1356 length:1296 start_codon:yes stop_codon:yes gene_type:complete